MSENKIQNLETNNTEITPPQYFLSQANSDLHKTHLYKITNPYCYYGVIFTPESEKTGIIKKLFIDDV